VAGVALNWDGEYLKETIERHDEVNGSIDVLLNFLGFMYVGVIMPWETFHDPDGTGITLPRLIGLGFLVLFFRRIPALMIMYKAMPSCITSWKEAVFMGYVCVLPLFSNQGFTSPSRPIVRTHWCWRRLLR